ncbi:hypothetical protein ANN_26589 [Periplaneta americana]|uniref:Uncharacterized protein n=1 Tax=Periplaneta americana TaxID=6978 RepID=A0ABQ8RYN7_PERAM|nr:hypothetical protein ANN_26589 [Periplaneta americana]
MPCFKIRFRKPHATTGSGGFIVLSTRYLRSGWTIVPLFHLQRKWMDILEERAGRYHRTPVVEGGSKRCFRFSKAVPVRSAAPVRNKYKLAPMGTENTSNICKWLDEDPDVGIENESYDESNKEDLLNEVHDSNSEQDNEEEDDDYVNIDCVYVFNLYFYLIKFIIIFKLIFVPLPVPIFKAMIKYAWYASKLINEREVFVKVKDICFAAEVRKNVCDCGQPSFICCACIEYVIQLDMQLIFNPTVVIIMFSELAY